MNIFREKTKHYITIQNNYLFPHIMWVIKAKNTIRRMILTESFLEEGSKRMNGIAGVGEPCGTWVELLKVEYSSNSTQGIDKMILVYF